MNKLLEHHLDVQMPITANKKRMIIGKSILLHNAGTNPVTVNNNLTMAAGATFQFNVINPGEIIAQTFSFKFSGGGTNRVEIVTTMPVDCDYSNYNPH